MHSSLDYKQRSKICGKSVALWRKNRGRCEHSDKKAAPDGAAGRSIFTSAEREWSLNGSCCGLTSLVVHEKVRCHQH